MENYYLISKKDVKAIRHGELKYEASKSVAKFIKENAVTILDGNGDYDGYLFLTDGDNTSALVVAYAKLSFKSGDLCNIDVFNMGNKNAGDYRSKIYELASNLVMIDWQPFLFSYKLTEILSEVDFTEETYGNFATSDVFLMKSDYIKAGLYQHKNDDSIYEMIVHPDCIDGVVEYSDCCFSGESTNPDYNMTLVRMLNRKK